MFHMPRLGDRKGPSASHFCFHSGLAPEPMTMQVGAQWCINQLSSLRMSQLPENHDAGSRCSSTSHFVRARDIFTASSMACLLQAHYRSPQFPPPAPLITGLQAFGSLLLPHTLQVHSQLQASALLFPLTGMLPSKYPQALSLCTNVSFSMRPIPTTLFQTSTSRLTPPHPQPLYPARARALGILPMALRPPCSHLQQPGRVPTADSFPHQALHVSLSLPEDFSTTEAG